MAIQNVVAATKLAIPTARQSLLPRPTLAARLDTDHRFTLVSAPAGYGKTATLASWADSHRDRLAWLSCDASDAEPTRFMSCLLATISERWPGAADDALVLLARDGANTYDPAIAVANELASVDSTGVIVVDDLHLAAPAPETLAAFVEALPEGFRFVAGTRSDPPMSLSRLRMRGDLLELRGDDLRFVAAELSEFFALHDVSLTPDELVRLHELTEGWPAGAQLAAIALQGGAAREEFLDAFASTDRAVSDFLLSEVLSNLPTDLVEFLVETSVLEAFDAELCFAVTGNEESGALLERVLAANLFVVPVGQRSGWYRYHHLFGAFLRSRLGALGGSRLKSAHERASRVLEQRGDISGALRHAMAAGDVDRAGQVVRAAVVGSMSMPQGADADVAVQAVRLWLHELGPQFVERDPTWVVELVLGLISLTGPDDAPAWLDRVSQAHPNADSHLVAHIEGTWSEHHQYRGQPLEAIKRLRTALDAVGGKLPSQGVLPLLHTGIARAHLQAGQLEAAAGIIQGALDHPVGNAVVDEVRHPGIAAFVAALSGDLSSSEALARQAEQGADHLGLAGHELGRVFAGLAMVELHVERNDLDAASELVEQVRVAGDASHRVPLQSQILLHRAKVARILGDEVGAEALLTQTRLLYRDPDEAFRDLLGDEAVAQALAFDLAKAATLLEGLDGSRVEVAVFRARLALIEGEARGAAAHLAGLPEPTTRRARVERSVLWALSLVDRDVESANAHLRDGLAAGRPERLIRSVVEHGPGVHRLLASYAPEASEEAYVDDLMVATSTTVVPGRAEPGPTLVEHLSDREVAVLRYLSSRLTYREIAAALYISVNTLKTHVKNVYRKLEVASRQEAVDVGRRLRLI